MVTIAGEGRKYGLYLVFPRNDQTRFTRTSFRSATT